MTTQTIIDIRFYNTFFEDEKTIELEARLGPQGLVSLWRLFVWASNDPKRQKGELHGVSDAGLEIAAKWTGERGLFVATILELEWIAPAIPRPSGYRLVNWKKKQPHVYSAAERSEAAREKALNMWGKRKGGVPSEEPPACTQHEDGNAPVNPVPRSQDLEPPKAPPPDARPDRRPRKPRRTAGALGPADDPLRSSAQVIQMLIGPGEDPERPPGLHLVE